MVLAELADESGVCFPSHTTIAARSEISRRSVVDQMKALEERDLLTRSRRNDPHGHRTSDIIRLRMTAGFLSEPDAPREPALSELPAPRNEAKVQMTTSLSAPGSHEEVRGEVSKRGLRSANGPSRETTIPDGFPDAEAIQREQAYLRSKGWNIDAGLQAEKFRAHAEMNARTVKVWTAAFHQWIIKATEYARSDGLTPLPPATEDTPTLASDPWRSRMEGLKRNQYWNATDWGPRPGKPDCQAPAGILAEFGYGGANVVPIGQRGAA
jgi:hypothetical protein